MEALIKVTPAEFNIELFEKIKSFLKNEYGLEVTISIRRKSAEELLANEDEGQYWTRLKKSTEEMEQGGHTIFSMEELDAYLHKNFSE